MKQSSMYGQEELLAAVEKLAREASEKILGVYASDFDSAEKADRSPLTEADLLSHATITSGLARLTPDIPVLSEESGAIPYSERARWQRYWLVDPLDGTKEFIKKNGEFTVNIALIEEQRSVLGVVHVPVSGVTFFAARGRGAFKREPGDGAVRRITTRKVDPARIVVAGSRSHGGGALDDFARRLPGNVELISRGSSLKLCLVAEGEADIYPRFGLTSEWDTAAAQAIVEEAGGVVLDLSFEPLRYNAKEDILNPWFVVLGDTSFGWREPLLAAQASAAQANA